MSELEYKMVCPKCNKYTIVMFSGSCKKGSCMYCGHNLPQHKYYNEYKGYVVDYNG